MAGAAAVSLAHGFTFSAVLCSGQLPFAPFLRRPSRRPLRCARLLPAWFFDRIVLALHLFQLGEGGQPPARQRPDERELGIVAAAIFATIRRNGR